MEKTSKHVRHWVRNFHLLSQLLLTKCHKPDKEISSERISEAPRVHSQQMWELRIFHQPTDFSVKGRFKAKHFLLLLAQLTSSHVYSCGGGGPQGGNSTENVRRGYTSAFPHESWLPFCAYETTTKMALYGVILAF